MFKIANIMRDILKRILLLFRRIRNYFTILILRLKGCDISWSAVIHPSAIFELSYGSIKIGKKTYIDRGVILRAMGGSIQIGTDCSVNAYSFLSGAGGINIADNVMIASHVSIYASNHVFTDISVPMNTQGLSLEGIEIEPDVWVGTGVRILDGVRISSGSIIAAGAVITKSIDSYSICGGVPACVIGSRLLDSKPIS